MTSWLLSTQVAVAPTGASADEGVGDDLRERGRRPRRRQPVEVERLVQLVGTHVAGHRLGARCPGLGDRHPVARRTRRGPAATAGRRRGPRAGPTSARRRAGARPSAVLAGIDRPVHRRSASRQARPPCSRPWATSTRKPSTPRSSQNRSTSSNIAGTSGLRQSRSGWVLSKRWRYHWPSGDPRPRRSAEHRDPVVRRLVAVLAAPVAEQVAGALRAARAGGERGLEPRVLARGVVGHQVDDHLELQRRGPRPGARRRRRGRRTAGRRRSSRRRRSRGRAAGSV